MKLLDPDKNREYLILAGTVTGACISIFLLYYYIFPASGAVLKFITPIILPFILAGIISILIDPLIKFFMRRIKFSRGWAVFTSLFLVIGVVSSVLTLISVRLFLELQKLSQNVPDMTVFLEQLAIRAHTLYLKITFPDEVIAQLQIIASKLGTSLTKGVTVAINNMLSFFALLPGVMIMLIILLIATFFFSRDKVTLGRSFLKIVPSGWRQGVISVYLDFSQAVVGYFQAQLTLITLNTMIAITGLYVIGVEYALIMGLVTGFFDVLPIFGPGSVFIPWAIYNLIVGNIRLAVSLIVLYVVMIVSRQIMEPKLVAQNLGVHPLATLAAIFIGLKVIGVLGIFIGPAILVLGQAIIKVRNESLGR